MPTKFRVRWPKRGPYYRRRVKRTAGDQRNYQWPSHPFTIIAGKVILCHPDYIPVLREALREQGVKVS